MKSISRGSERSRYRNGFKSKIKGIAIIEFTIVVSLFFALFLTVVDLGIYGFVKLTMQHSAREGARYAITGRSDLDPDASSDREAAILEKISKSSSGLLDKVMDVQNIRVEDVYGNAVTGFGGSGDIISIHLDCEWPSVNPYMYVLLDDGKFKFTVSAAMKNEAF
ncbi:MULTISPECIES: TadE family protein [Vibrio]|uniref:TadE family protein n=1 Tax=Vibrio TaxID=662 RepID=UPI001C000FF0|nr:MULTISPECIES: TadE family protein [Vibrio]MBT9240746.1 pilus assembly protein [Vibrio splendidus]MCT4348361.1 pilus assembly protein [Vibrio sp. NC2]MDP2615684.1 pilus assembly protein [Vibrio splendidus]